VQPSADKAQPTADRTQPTADRTPPSTDKAQFIADRTQPIADYQMQPTADKDRTPPSADKAQFTADRTQPTTDRTQPIADHKVQQTADTTQTSDNDIDDNLSVFNNHFSVAGSEAIPDIKVSKNETESTSASLPVDLHQKTANGSKNILSSRTDERNIRSEAKAPSEFVQKKKIPLSQSQPQQNIVSLVHNESELEAQEQLNQGKNLQKSNKKKIGRAHV